MWSKLMMRRNGYASLAGWGRGKKPVCQCPMTERRNKNASVQYDSKERER